LQATVPDSVFTTHLFFTPNDTWRAVVPILQLLPSSAHFEKPAGQSMAKAGVAAAQAMATRVSRSGFIRVVMGSSFAV
jgi:hypothetical protein